MTGTLDENKVSAVCLVEKTHFEGTSPEWKEPPLPVLTLTQDVRVAMWLWDRVDFTRTESATRKETLQYENRVSLPGIYNIPKFGQSFKTQQKERQTQAQWHRLEHTSLGTGGKQGNQATAGTRSERGRPVDSK